MGLPKLYHGSIDILLGWLVAPSLLDRLGRWAPDADIDEFVTHPTPDFRVTPVTDET